MYRENETKSLRRFASLWQTGLLMAFSGIAGHAGILYNQPVCVLNQDGCGSFASQNDPSGLGNFATTYDNFTLTSDATVTGIDWVGGYFNPDSQGTITSFTLGFYADNAGVPGAQLAVVTAPSGDFTETSLGTDFFGDLVYDYTVTGASVGLSGGTQYWLSIVPTMTFPPQWGWQNGTGGDSQSYQVFFGTGIVVTSDSAFTLIGNPTPEPATLTLIGLGLAGVGFAARRKRQSSK